MCLDCPSFFVLHRVRFPLPAHLLIEREPILGSEPRSSARYLLRKAPRRNRGQYRVGDAFQRADLEDERCIMVKARNVNLKRSRDSIKRPRDSETTPRRE